MIDDAELARRSILGFGEMVAALGAGVWAPRLKFAGLMRWARGSTPRSITPGSTRRSCRSARCRPPTIRGCRTASGPWPTPCRGGWRSRGSRRRAWPSARRPALVLDGGATHVEAPSLAVLGDINERAYGQSGVFGPLVQALRDERIRTHGLREAGEFVCVALDDGGRR